MKKSVLIILLMTGYLQIAYSQCGCCGSASGFSGGESSLGDITLNRKSMIIETLADYRAFNGIKNQVTTIEHGVATQTALAVSNMVIGVLSLKYGVNSRLSLLIREPTFLINSAGSDIKSFGDLLTAVNYRAVNRPDVVVETQAGIEWPTGQFVALTNGSAITTGSGSFDPIVGASLKLPFNKSTLRVAGVFKHTTRGYNQTYFGNFCGHQLDYTYVLSSKIEECTSDSTQPKPKPVIALKTLLSGEWSQMQKKGNLLIENTGAYVVLAGLGFMFSYKDFTIPITFSVPVLQKFHGAQNGNQCRVMFGISKTFN